jgi:alkyldihydroxyacetonephosphate synthase
MRRWNGWGEEREHAELPDAAARLLERVVGPGTPPRDATLADVVAHVPGSRLDDDPLLSTDPADRVRHARGQSLHDWIDVRTGRLEAVPDAVARPHDGEQVRALLRLAAGTGAVLIPYGGGTSVVGGVSVRSSERPVITVDLGRLSGIRGLDERSGLVTVGAGTTGPRLDTELAADGWTVGHEPQSWELATVGGWVAARGAGLRSLGQGRIEALFAGGTLEAPAGTLTMPTHPASAAGPDIRQLVLGSEGRLGILTDIVLRASPVPEADVVDAHALPSWDAGMEAARAVAQLRPGLSFVRLSTPTETQSILAMAEHPGQVRALRSYLGVRRVPKGWSLLLVGASGRRRPTRAAARDAAAIVGRHGAVGVPGLAASWRRGRFRAAYLRNTLWEAGYASDTLETATDWTRLPEVARSVAQALRRGLDDEGERVHVFSHLSHMYPSGSSLYVTYLYRIATDPDVTLERWRTLKTAASEAIVAAGGTISHHHGVGVDHAAYLAAEKGELGMAALRSAIRTFDPDGVMHPGVLV